MKKGLKNPTCKCGGKSGSWYNQFTAWQCRKCLEIIEITPEEVEAERIIQEFIDSGRESQEFENVNIDKLLKFGDILQGKVS